MSIHYGLEKFKSAILLLVEPGDIHSRVQAAMCQHIIHLSPSSDVSEIIKDEVQSLLNQYHDNCAQKISGLNENDVEHLAKQIIEIYCKWLESLH